MLERKHFTPKECSSLSEIVLSEGFKPEPLPAWLKKSEGLINTAIKLWGFIPEDSDPRWQIVSGFNKALCEHKFTGENFENALQAIYLSKIPSYRNEYGKFAREPNMRQLLRAIKNVASWPKLQTSFENSRVKSQLPEEISLSLAKTNRLTRGADQKGITGCPEALYQLRFFHKRDYMGRVGFNLHQEYSTNIFSITNVQGVPGSAIGYSEIERKYGLKAFNLLVKKVVRVAREFGNADVRGLKNPRDGDSGFYNSVFKSEGIKRFSFKRVRS